MQGKEHLAFGFASATALTLALYTPESQILASPASVIGFSMIGSLLPDIDNPTSTVGSALSFVSVPLNHAVGHRTLTHDIAIAIPLFVLSIILKNPIIFGLMFGIMSHLFLDSFNKNGVAFNYFKNYKKGKKVSKKGSFFLLPSFLRFYSSSFTAKAFTVAVSVALFYIANVFSVRYFGTNLVEHFEIMVQNGLL